MTCSVKNVPIGSFSGPHFPPFGRNMERYWEMREIRIRKAASTATFPAVTMILHFILSKRST